jgi:cytochrome c biogenesis protein CcdA
MRQSWSETFRALGSAVLGLLKAELEALEQDVARSGKNAALGIALFATAAAFSFWTLGVATYFLVQLLALWLQLWAAALVVTLLFAGVAGGLAFAGLKKLEKFENPIGTARRRLDDHIDWWQNRLLVPGEPRRRVPPPALGADEEGRGGLS